MKILLKCISHQLPRKDHKVNISTNSAINYQRTAIKMQLMCDQVKSMQNNEKMVNTFNNMTNLVSQQMGQIDTAKMADQLQMFNDKMDEVLINNKMMT